MNTAVALLISVGLLVANAFFVAAEFAVIAAKTHRLEEAAAAGDRLARTAVRNARDLSLGLAGAQLGITLCTLGLGALAKPAVASVLEVALGAVQVPEAVAGVVSVLLAVSLVVFLHMVIGEMAPKSWAISDPEHSARILAWPFRAFVVTARPILAALNGLANICLRAVKVEPQDELAQVHGPRELRMLLSTSREHGMLVPGEHRMLAGALSMAETPVRDMALPIEQAVSIPRRRTPPRSSGSAARAVDPGWSSWTMPASRSGWCMCSTRSAPPPQGRAPPRANLATRPASYRRSSRSSRRSGGCRTSEPSWPSWSPRPPTPGCAPTAW